MGISELRDEIGKFWVVTTPTEFSILEDILFETDIAGLFYQFRGGLEIERIEGIYKDKERASKAAEKLLAMGRR